jgi:hypothetical protein
MRPEDFIEEVVKPSGFGFDSTVHRFRRDVARRLRQGPVDEAPDPEVAVGLARLIHDELEAYGTGGGEVLDDADLREALQALRTLCKRLGVRYPNVPFRDFTTFRSYWIRTGASGAGGWQARRDILSAIFDFLHDDLADLESRSLASSLAEAVSPRGRTGWARVDAEVAELRRHFQAATTPQDYRNVGNDCVIVLEAISAAAYEPARHLHLDESEPPVAKTKDRLDRVVEVELPDRENAELRKLARATIEAAQAIKHRTTPTRRDAGLAADATIMLANLMRRLRT